jgi:hypothetical protein
VNKTGRHSLSLRGLPTLRAALTVTALGIAPCVLFAAGFAHWLQSGTLAWDFHHELYPQAHAMLDGDNPYPPPGHDPATGTNLVWPPLAAYLVAPLTALPPGAADPVMALLGIGVFGASLWTVGVRDWRVYGAFALWPPVFIEPGLSHLTPFVALLIAATWRARDARYASGVLVGLAVGLKLLVWPLGLWLASVGRMRAAVVAMLVAGLSLLLVLPYTTLGDYTAALRALGRTYDQDSYTLFGLLAQAGASDAAAHTATLVLGIGLLVGTWRSRSFTLAVAAALVISPIVWLDYFALAAIPLAIVRPRLSPVWFVPLATAGAGGAGLDIAGAFGMGRVLLPFAVVFAVTFLAERRRETATGRIRDAAPTRRIEVDVA